MRKHTKILSVLIVWVTGLIFTPISSSHADDYKRRQIEYSEKKKNDKDWIQSNKEDKYEFCDLATRYEEAENEYRACRERFNNSLNSNNELEKFLNKRRDYLNIMEEYSERVEAL